MSKDFAKNSPLAIFYKLLYSHDLTLICVMCCAISLTYPLKCVCVKICYNNICGYIATLSLLSLLSATHVLSGMENFVHRRLFAFFHDTITQIAVSY